MTDTKEANIGIDFLGRSPQVMVEQLEWLFKEKEGEEGEW